MKRKELPQKVKKALEAIKSERKAYVEVKYKKNSYYYVFEATSKFDKNSKKRRKITSYIGRLDAQGNFISAKHRSTGFMQYISGFIPRPVGRELERIRENNSEAYIGRIEEGRFYVYNSQTDVPPKPLGIISESGSFTSATPEGSVLYNEPKISSEEQRILQALSMNARMSFSNIGKFCGITEQAAYSRVKSLEKRFGIRYLLEPDVLKLGFSTFIILVKFSENVPEVSVLTEALANEPKIQFAALTKGSYDLMIYLLEDNNIKVGSTIWRLRTETQLKNYNSVWHISPFDETYGFVPLRDQFVEQVLKSKEWKRSKGGTDASSTGRLLRRELAVLTELNRNSTTEFTTIDKQTGYTRGASQYTYYRLKEKGIIKRCTITLDHLPLRYVGIILLDFTNTAIYSSTRHNLFWEIFKDRNVINKFNIVGDIGTPHGGILIMPIFQDNDLQNSVASISSHIKGISLSTLVITDTIVGSLCYRRFDEMYSLQYALLEDGKYIELKEKVSYD